MYTLPSAARAAELSRSLLPLVSVLPNRLLQVVLPVHSTAAPSQAEKAVPSALHVRSPCPQVSAQASVAPGVQAPPPPLLEPPELLDCSPPLLEPPELPPDEECSPPLLAPPDEDCPPPLLLGPSPEEAADRRVAAIGGLCVATTTRRHDGHEPQPQAQPRASFHGVAV